jgi:hypothetical protein
MKIIAIKDMSAGNAEVGEMWKETKIFEPNATVEEVMDWVGERKNVVLTIAEE